MLPPFLLYYTGARARSKQENERKRIYFMGLRAVLAVLVKLFAGIDGV
jgi:hypothetical protein